MALELKQQVKLAQQLVMTPQLQQAIRLLQLSQLELVSTVQQELMENPVLEEVPEDEGVPGDEEAFEANGVAAEAGPSSGIEADEEGREPASEEPSPEEIVADLAWEDYMDARPQTSLGRPDEEDRRPLEETLTRSETLAEHLLWQLQLSELGEAERRLGALVIGNLDARGYLDADLAALAAEAGVDLETAERVLRTIQEFDPVGCGARSLEECLLVQARVHGIDDPLVRAIIERHLPTLQRKDLRAIARAENVEVAEVARAARAIAQLDPRPGRQYEGGAPVYVTPDIFVHKVGDEYHVVLNDEGLPRLRVSSAYRKVLAQREAPRETREYVREKLRSAVWLIRSIHQRQRTIVRVMESIIRFQRDFFDRGIEYLRPLNLRDVADDIGMHESTVSRVTTNKYVQTPHGIFELKFFFNSSIATGDGDAVASESVKEKIREIIRNEDPRNPLSDQKIAEILRASNIRIARRTVTKYREAMGILASSQRRRFDEDGR